jgi:predicted enzyme related to lactoylglutathione lyase
MDVAGIGLLPEGAEATGWNTVIAVASVDAAASRALDCGGELLLPPTDATPAGCIAVVRDPGGAVFCLWEAQERRGAQLVNEPSAWAMSALQTADPDRAATFYREMFGWEAQSVTLGEMQVTLMRLPGYVGGEPGQPVPRDVVAVMMPTNGDDVWTVDFWTDDAANAAAAASDLGGRVLAEPFEVPQFTRALLADPSGAVFSVSQLQVDR